MDEETAILLAVIERMKNCGGTGTTYIQDDEIVKKCETARTSVHINTKGREQVRHKLLYVKGRKKPSLLRVDEMVHSVLEKVERGHRY